ncbi:MAG: hypothetical protein V4627_12200 [Pseudomonadota bacterium]
MSPSTSVLSSLMASPHFLRRVLWADAGIGVLTGLEQYMFADVLAPILGLPASLLSGSAVALAGFVLFIAWIATRKSIPAGAVWLLIGANALWVVGCLGLLASSLVAPTAFGVAFLIIHAVSVGVFVELEWIGVRKLQPAPAW